MSPFTSQSESFQHRSVKPYQSFPYVSFFDLDEEAWENLNAPTPATRKRRSERFQPFEQRLQQHTHNRQPINQERSLNDQESRNTNY